MMSGARTKSKARLSKTLRSITLGNRTPESEATPAPYLFPSPYDKFMTSMRTKELKEEFLKKYEVLATNKAVTRNQTNFTDFIFPHATKLDASSIDDFYPLSNG